MDALRDLVRPFSLQRAKQGAGFIFIPHFFTNILLSVCFFIVKTISPACDYLFDDCVLELVSDLSN